jgi:UDP-N-acetylmuramyl tripeptide synthase
MEKILRFIEKIVPKKVYRFFQPVYHYLLAVIGTIIYRNPSRSIYVIGVTGTKGKSSTTEFINAVLEAADKKTAILSTIRFKIGTDTRPKWRCQDDALRRNSFAMPSMLSATMPLSK